MRVSDDCLDRKAKGFLAFGTQKGQRTEIHVLVLQREGSGGGEIHETRSHYPSKFQKPS